MKKVIQISTLLLFSLLMAGFVAYRAGWEPLNEALGISIPQNQALPDSIVIDGKKYKLDTLSAAERERYNLMIFSSKSMVMSNNYSLMLRLDELTRLLIRFPDSLRDDYSREDLFQYGLLDPELLGITKPKLKVLVLPPYDQVANRGASPHTQKMLEVVFTDKPGFELVPFGRKHYQTHYQNIFDKAYLGPILEVEKPDVILMSRLELIDWGDNMDESLWSLSLRYYESFTEEQFDSELTFIKLDQVGLQDQISKSAEALLNEIESRVKPLRVFQTKAISDD